jgi:hypothetical protein
MIKHFVQYFYPGTFFDKSSVDQIEHRDPHKLIAYGELPPAAVAFQFFDREYVGATTDHGDRIETLTRDAHNESLRYYPEATVLDADGVAALGGDKTIALWNMESNTWSRVIRTRRGTLKPFDSKAMAIL